MSLLISISRIPLPIAIALSVLVLCGWIPDFLACDYSSFAAAFPLYFTFGLTLVNAYIVFIMMRATGMVRYRDLLPVFLYLLTTTAFPAIHTWWQLQACIVCTTILVKVIQCNYREEENAADSFRATVLALIASLFVPQAVFLVPLIWVAYIFLRAIHFRTFLASLIAIGVFLIYLALTIMLGGADCPYVGLFYLPDWQTLIGLPATADSAYTTSLALVYGLFVLLHYVLCIVATVRINRDSAGQQTLLVLLYLFFLPTATAVFFFRQNQSIARSITFILYLLLLLVAYTVFMFA